MLKRFVVGGLLAALALSLVPAAWGASPRSAVSPTIRPYTVWDVSTREQRSDLVAQGFDIGERAWAEHVVLYGTKAQALAIIAHGYRVQPQSVDDSHPTTRATTTTPRWCRTSRTSPPPIRASCTSFRSEPPTRVAT